MKRLDMFYIFEHEGLSTPVVADLNGMLVEVDHVEIAFFNGVKTAVIHLGHEIGEEDVTDE